MGHEFGRDALLWSWGEIWMAASSWGEVGSAFLALEDVASWYVSYVASWYVSLVWVGLLGRLLGPLLGLWPFECGDFLAGFKASHLPFAIRPISRGRRTGARCGTRRLELCRSSGALGLVCASYSRLAI